MPRPRVFTKDVVSRIPDWRDQGLSTLEIADRIGCTPGTLRVRCSQLGISLRRSGKVRTPPKSIYSAKLGSAQRAKLLEEHVVFPHQTMSLLAPTPQAASRSESRVEITLLLSDIVIKRLRQRADLMGVNESDLAATLVETITGDNLFGAILDID
jgi:hypothetical protein